MALPAFIGKSLAIICLLSAASAIQATPVAYDVSWTGANGYSMTGSFTYDTSAGTEVRDSEVTSLSMAAWLNGVAFNTWSLGDPFVGVFNFNFNALTGTFFTGGASAGDNGQNWNSIAGTSCTAGEVGFTSGSNFQGICNFGQLVGAIPVSASTLIATRVNNVPEPGSLALVGVGIAGLVVARKRKQA